MPLRQKEDIDDPGVPIAFLRDGEVMVREGLGGLFVRRPTIPLDGRVYVCGGEIILNNGQRLPAHFELETSKRHPFLESSLWCTPDERRTWYQLRERELLDALSLARADLFPIRWRPGRPLDHHDPGPYPTDWSPGGPRPKLRHASSFIREQELSVWIAGLIGAGAALFFCHAFPVTRATYVSDGVLLAVTTFLFWMRFRPRPTPRTRPRAIASNVTLALLTIAVILYLAGIINWYEVTLALLATAVMLYIAGLVNPPG